MDRNRILFSLDLNASITEAINGCPHDRLFVLTDKHTKELCWPLVKDIPCMQDAQMITIGCGDEFKTLDTLTAVWTNLQQGGATRHSLLVNLGGGMLTDLGGFAAGTFKRGIRFINVPTTLLSMVDASVGGKTGINYGGLKNEIGLFCPAEYVVLDTVFLKTLDDENLLSGYAEMLKHSLISHTSMWARLLNFDLEDIDLPALLQLLRENVEVKERIVDEDPTEKGIRKALNLGHTAGHALESLALKEDRPILHGYAVAWGLVCELYLSVKQLGFPKEKLQQTMQFIRENYGTFRFDCKEYETLYHFMLHDKKNEGGNIRFTLLADIGDVRIDQTVSHDEILDMLDFYRETLN